MTSGSAEGGLEGHGDPCEKGREGDRGLQIERQRGRGGRSITSRLHEEKYSVAYNYGMRRKGVFQMLWL